MANQKIESTGTPTTGISTKSDRAGLLPSVVNLALDVADRTQSTTLAVLQDARVELRSAIESTIDLAEKFSTALFRLTRKSVQRVDDASAETLNGVGAVLGGAVKGARDTTRAAAELATTATANVAGQAAA